MRLMESPVSIVDGDSCVPPVDTKRPAVRINNPAENRMAACFNVMGLKIWFLHHSILLVTLGGFVKIYGEPGMKAR